MTNVETSRSPASRPSWPQVLKPFDKREAVSVAVAARLAGRTERTLRLWCVQHAIGRRIANGRWYVSKIALAMLLDGNEAALRAYAAGDRCGPLVSEYFKRAGLADMLCASAA